MSIVGADVAALRAFASSLRCRQREIETTLHRLTFVVENMAWSGRDRDRFVDEWRGVHGPGIARLIHELSMAVREVSDHAHRQEHASRHRS
jgi:uncharacterized protein YukE